MLEQRELLTEQMMLQSRLMRLSAAASGLANRNVMSSSEQTASPSTQAPESSHGGEHRSERRYLLTAMLGALGVVYGDIGTSPLYAFRECFHESHGLAVEPQNILGVLSLILWALIIEISVKYILFVMRADNRGEGGVLTLMALAAHPQRPMRDRDYRRYLLLLGLFGSALLYGDGIITPAISVLSAVEGLNVATTRFDPYVIPITLVILFTLFSVQRHGTARMGQIFGPVILVWFFTIGILGFFSILRAPEVFRAINPQYGISLLFTHSWTGFLVLGSVFLAVTGGEALYADMGHFGKRPIQMGWFYIALPALLLNYLGQAALMLKDPSAADNPFYRIAPQWMLYPLVIIATMATVIASQALITGAFSLTRQAVQLGCLPRVSIFHTSSQEIGQIFVPLVNRSLLISTIFMVLMFRSSSAMAAAYGIAVSMTMVITTVLIYFVAREKWHWSRLRAGLITGTFLAFDLAFFLANAAKLHHGGWVPLIIGALIFSLMTTWRTGRRLLAARLLMQTTPIERFCESIQQSNPVRVPGTAIFMTGNVDSTPAALVHNNRLNKVLHQTIVLLTVQVTETPTVAEKDRVQVTKFGDGFYKMIILSGFMETVSVPTILADAKRYGIPFAQQDIVYFLGRETVLATEAEGMAIWREQLFAFMTRNAERATTYYGLPSDRVIEIGFQVEI